MLWTEVLWIDRVTYAAVSFTSSSGGLRLLLDAMVEARAGARTSDDSSESFIILQCSSATASSLDAIITSQSRPGSLETRCRVGERARRDDRPRRRVDQRDVHRLVAVLCVPGEHLA